MGSGFAGVKAGVLAGVFYVGTIALFNVLLLYVLKQDVLKVISQQDTQFCTSTAATNSTASVEDCFSSVVVGYIPVIAFLGFFISLVYSWVFGRFYEYFPAKGAKTKGVMIALVVLLNLLVFDLTGIPFNQLAADSIGVFVLVDTAIYGMLLGYLYRRYTKLVEFATPAGSALKILVDRRNFTGKSRTFATKSVHEIRGEAAEGGSFKEWAVSGGVTVEDSRSFETTMEVNGDGMLKAISKKG